MVVADRESRATRTRSALMICSAIHFILIGSFCHAQCFPEWACLFFLDIQIGDILGQVVFYKDRLAHITLLCVVILQIMRSLILSS